MPYKDPEARKRYAKMHREENREYYRDAWNKWSSKNPKKNLERRYKYLSTELNRKKSNARRAVFYAIKTGKLIRPDYCSRCSVPCQPEADHHDYDKKLDVTWLCKSCHTLITIERKNGTLKT